MDLLGSTSAPYRVLARTYRPTRLSELIGQEALVRTLRNALASGRIAHAFLLCGIRGVGKTTTARIIARGLNCTGLDGHGGPTPEPCGECPSCRAIAADRDIDVIEMDAASQTGKDDVLELLEGVMFAPASSRYKVYILDEAHMLSPKAWNALLKTVEEPPPHVKFVFATTEPRKVPVTVLSRCQRFDLRRVEAATLLAHLAGICQRESIAIDEAALALIVRAAEGSVRDALSLLDQAVAMSEGPVAAVDVQAMLGLGDRLRLLDLLDAALRGDVALTLERSEALYGLGVDPLSVVQDLLEATHTISRAKVRPVADLTLEGEAAALVEGLAQKLDLAVLARAWQILLRGIDEVRNAPDAAMALEMLLMRLASVSDLPPPAELARLWRGAGGGETAAAVAAGATKVAAARRLETARPKPKAQLEAPTFAALVDGLAAAGESLLAAWLRQSVRCVRFEPGQIEIRLLPGAPGDLAARLAAAARRVTGRPWLVALSQSGGAPTLAEEAQAGRERRIAEIGALPSIRTLLETFPGATIVDVRRGDP